MSTGWYGDDAAFSLLPAQLRATHTTLFAAIGAANALWVHANGRFFPLAIVEKYAVFAALTNVAAYKAFLLVCTLASLCVFYAFVVRLAGRDLAAVATLFVVGCIQERAYHDSLFSYNGMLQLVTILLFVSLALSIVWCRSGSGGALAWATVLYAAACGTYEIAYALVPVYAATLACVTRSAARVVRGTLPFFATALVFCAASVALRLHAHVAANSAYAVHFDLPIVATTFAKEIVAAVPLTYFAFNAQRAFPPFTLLLQPNQHFTLRLWIAALAALTAVAVLAGYRTSPRRYGAGGVTLAIFIATLPALLPAFSPKYQHELDWGIGYLPVFLQCFGMGLLGAVVVHRLLARGGRTAFFAKLALTVAIAAVFTLQRGANEHIVLAIGDFKDSRERLERELRQGLVASLHDGSRVALVPAPAWACYRPGCPDDVRTEFLFFQYGGKRLTLVADPRAADATIDMVRGTLLPRARKP